MGGFSEKRFTDPLLSACPHAALAGTPVLSIADDSVFLSLLPAGESLRPTPVCRHVGCARRRVPDPPES